MLSLRDLQLSAYRAIVLDEDGEFSPAARGGGAAAGLGVYRNNARETFHKTLVATYPVVRRLVGDLCFRGLARSYMREFPSRSGDLGRFGAELPTLLTICYRDTRYEYLSDVARLEWACAEAETAADGVAFDPVLLADVQVGEYGELRFMLRAPVRLVGSRYPVLSIWEANQADDVTPVALGLGAEHALVTRSNGGVRVHRLDVGTFAFARSLADGDSLADAVCAGEAVAADFSATGALRTLWQLEVLAGFRLPADEVA
jgi:hypothetical protein